jgi:hypothetical protein
MTGKATSSKTHLPSVCSMKLPSGLHRRCTSPIVLPLSMSFISHLLNSANEWPHTSAVLVSEFQLAIIRTTEGQTLPILGTCEPAVVSGTARRRVQATPPWQSAQLQPLRSALAAGCQTRLPTGSTLRLP